MKIRIEKKKKIFFTLIIGSMTTGIITFVLNLVNVGLTETLIINWAKSWIIAYFVVVPVTLSIAPSIQKMVDEYFDFNKQ